ncbi:MAG: glycosyltransferase family 4 protein [Ramlibacter sp.]|nr:glycosyltransferase family 4 protein [Ramlibacter sp.]
MRILYVVNNAAFFCSHRLPLAIAARKAGHEVALITGQAGSVLLEASAVQQLKYAGIRHIATRFKTGGISPFSELIGFCEVVRAVSAWQPDIIHCASPKGLLYGGLAARFAACPAVVLAVSGMGSLFAGPQTCFKSLMRNAYLTLVRMAYSHPKAKVIVQNTDDRELVVGAGFATAADIRLVPGSGVQLDTYVDLPIEGRGNIVVLPARLLKNKGVVEFVRAARLLRATVPGWRFVLVGTADYDNPSAISLAQIRAWVDEGVVEWWGHSENMDEVLAQAAIVCLPSYREGMPKALLEAAAAGCAIVTTDAVGCRDAIEPGKSGDLVPIADVSALAEALLKLIQNPARRLVYGAAGRDLARRKFDLQIVIDTTMEIYAELGNSPIGNIPPPNG